MTDRMRSKPQQERSKKKLRQILDAADAELGEKGIEAAQMTAIAKRAGISAASVYRFFPDKEALCDALVDDYREDTAAVFAPVLASFDSATDLLDITRAMLKASFDLYERHPGYYALAAVNWKTPATPTGAVRDANVEMIDTQLHALGVMTDNPKRRFLALNYVFETMRHLLFIGPAPGSTKKAHHKEIETMMLSYVEAVSQG